MSSTTWNSPRGRNAESPKDIPAKGWKDTLMRVKSEIKSDRLSLISAAMAYYALFAFVPAISSIIIIYAWVSDPQDISQHISKISQFIPAEVQSMLNEQLGALASKAPSALGLSAIGALLIALWSASKGSKAIIEALNIIYDEEDKRGFIKSNLLALGMTFLGAVLGIVAIVTVIAIPAITGFLNLPKSMEFIATASSWVILLGLFSLYLSFIYRYGPHRDQAKWKWVSWGAVVASVLWALASAGFSIYAKEFGNFNKTYGSFGAIIVLMMWFYISSFVILVGGELNAELEHQTKRDTTKGPEKPMGNRNAHMADTVGPTAEEVKSSGGKTSTSPDHHQNLWH